jgi:hypothetical protein
MMTSIYLANVVAWILIFAIVAILVQRKLGVLGFTIGVGGTLMVLFSVLQDAYDLGPTFLAYFPLNAYSVPLGIATPGLITALFALVSFLSTFFIEREFYKGATRNY